MTGHMSKFTLLCQAARLLGQVLHHLSGDKVSQDDAWIQLDRTLHSMLAAAMDVETPDWDQIVFIYRYQLRNPSLDLADYLNHSVILALYTPWLYPDRTNTVDAERSQRAKVVLQQIVEKIDTSLVKNRCFVGRDPEKMAPWGLFFAYHVCAALLRSGREISSESDRVVEGLRETILAVDVRWNAASTCVLFT